MRIDKFRGWARALHRDWGYFFAGVILIYSVSGFFLNHMRDFNPNYSVTYRELIIEDLPPEADSMTKEWVIEHVLTPFGLSSSYKHKAMPDSEHLKVFLDGGSSIILELSSGKARLEHLRRRFAIADFNRLHMNPSKWWTYFSDLFILHLILITLSGLIIVKGKKGMMGRGGLLFLLGLVFPLIFIFI